MKKQQKQKLHEISAKLAARYLVRRGAVFVDSRKKQITFPSNQMSHLERRAETSRLNVLKGSINPDDAEHLRVYKKTVKGTNNAMRKIYNRYSKRSVTAHETQDKIRDTLLDAERERLDQALLVGKSPTINMQIKKFAGKPTEPPQGEIRQKFTGSKKKTEQPVSKSEKQNPIDHIEPGVPTQHHVITNEGRVMFSGTKEKAAEMSRKFGNLKVVESNHPKLKVGSRLNSQEIKDLDKMMRKRKQNESFDPMNELSNKYTIRYIGSAIKDLNRSLDAQNKNRAVKRYDGINKALDKLEKRGRISPLKEENQLGIDSALNIQPKTSLFELSSKSLLRYAGAAERSFRSGGLSKRAIGIKRAFRALRNKQ
jgi:hypothetical protein